MARKKLVVFGILGTTLDAGKGNARWERWRPTVALTQHEDLLVDRFELLHGSKDAELLGQVTADIAHVSPETKVVTHVMDFRDPWDFEHVYEKLHEFAKSYPFDPDREDCLVHITTGTHVAQICLFLLTEARYFPARLLQTSPGDRKPQRPGNYAIIDLDLSKYDRLSARFKTEKAEAYSFLKSGIATKNDRFNALIERIEQVSIASRAPILLTGPTGAGKSKLAKRIFELKKARRQVSGQFAELNCATLRGDAAMSTLFGHTKGAFTGATADRPGLLRKADKGVLFLDEVGELGSDEQAMLLRAIEEKVFYPMGSDRAEQRLSAHLRHQPRLARPHRSRGISRGSLRAHQPLVLRATRPPRAAGGYRAEPRVRARAGVARARCQHHDEPRGEGALPQVCACLDLARQLSETSTPRSRAWPRSLRAVASPRAS